MKVWVTRDDGDIVFLWDVKPDRCGVRGYHIPIEQDAECEWSECFGSYIFKKLFGFTPRKGSCKRMELSLTEIK